MEDLARAAQTCMLPPELDDLELIAAIDGEAKAEVMAHLRACPYCAARAQQYAEIQGLLRKQLFRLFCPSTELLVAFQQNSLHGEQRAQIATHIEDCPHCSRELRLLQQMTGESDSVRSPPAGPELNLLAVPSKDGSFRRVVAELLAPIPRPRPSLFGALRGSGQTAHYAYHAENLQLMLGVQNTTQRGDACMITGTLELEDTSLGSGPATAYLLSSGLPVSTAEIDELGGFVFTNLKPGTYGLELHVSDLEVVVEALSL